METCPTCGNKMVRVEHWERVFPTFNHPENRPADKCELCGTLIEFRDDGTEGYSLRSWNGGPMIIVYGEPKLGEEWYG